MVVHCRNTRFRYPKESFCLEIPELFLAPGDKVALTGPSGCGKTTLLHLICGILRPESGSILIDGVEITSLSPRQSQAFRLRHIGLAPQRFELLDYLTVEENVLLPYRISASLALDSAIRDRAQALLERVGIASHRNRFPDRLSQGERQRTAICRALIHSPRLILADEPSSNLDPANQANLVALLLEQASAIGATVVMVTHEPSLLPQFDRAIALPEILALLTPAPA